MQQHLVRLLTELGSGAVIYPVLLALAVRSFRRGAHARPVALPLLLLAAGQVLEAVGSSTFVGPGPLGVDEVSFSSGHAMTAVLGWA